MSKSTLAIIAAASAATGAGLTAMIYSSKPRQLPPSPPPPVQPNIPASMPAAPSPVSRIPSTPVTSASIPLPAHTALTPQAAGPVDPAGLFQYGFPGPVSDLRNAASLTSAFDRRTRNPHWVAEHITPYSISHPNADRKHSVFVEDTSIPAQFRAKLADYYRSGYDRGHQVPAADCKWSQEAMDDTFALSNMCPQVGEGFNRDYWAHFEDFCRRLTTKYPSVRIVTGPLYLPKKDPVDGKWRVSYEVIGTPPNVAVPTHFYKVIYAEDAKTAAGDNGSVALGAFVLPNAQIPNQKSLTDFEVPVEAVERASGLEFTNKLPAARRKKLCQEIRCEIFVREFADRAKNKGGVPPPAR